ncbi:hypothetical protein ACP4OV_025138 [Aristida adscensionis]
MDDDAAAPAASPSPSPSSSSGVSRSPSSPRSKRRRDDRYALGFEFAPRLASYESLLPPPPPGRSPEWTERSTLALLDAWGDRFVRSGRRGIPADEWLEVARLAATAAGFPAGHYSESQCRNRIDTLRKKFRKEKERMRLASRRSRGSPSHSKWVYFDKMMSVLCPPLPPPPSPPSPRPLAPPPLQVPIVTRRRDTQPSPRLSWGLGAPELMLGGGGDVRPGDAKPDVAAKPDAAKLGGKQEIEVAASNSNGFGALTESIRKFGEVYERMERRKRQHMAEVEQIRKDFHRDLDAKWREILAKAEAEIACLEDEVSDGGNAEDADGGDDNGRLEDGGSEEQNNGAMNVSP